MSKKLAKSGYYLNNKNGFSEIDDAWNSLLTYINLNKDKLDILNLDKENLHIQIKLSNKNNNPSRYVPLPCFDFSKFENAYLRASATYNCKFENGKLVLSSENIFDEPSNIIFNIQCIKFPDNCEIFVKNIDNSNTLIKSKLLNFFKVGVLSYNYSIIKTNLLTLDIENNSRYRI